MDEFIIFDVKQSDLDNFGGPNVKEQGLQILNSGHIIQVGVISKNVIEAVCIQSSHPSETPHKITINTGTVWTDWKFSCSCKAGLSQRCKHIFAVLCYIERFKKIEILTCTQKQQRWNQVSKEVVNSVLQPSKIIDLPEVKKRKVDYGILPAEQKLFTEVLFGAKKSAVSKFMLNFMNRKKPSDENKNLVPSLGIVEQNLNAIDQPKEETVESYLKEIFCTQDLKQKIHFFDKESTSMQVIQFYNKWICIDNEAAAAIHSSTLGQDHSFELQKGKRMRIKTEDCYPLYTFFKNKKRTDNEWQKKTATYLKKKKNGKSLKLEKEQQSSAFELYAKLTGKRVEKFGLLIHPTCPWLCATPDGLCLESKALIKIKCLIDTKNEGFPLMLQKLSYLKFNTDASGNISYELKKKHACYAELQLNMFLLNCQKCNLVFFDVNKGSFHPTVEVLYDSAFVFEILPSLKTIYMRYFLDFIFENMLKMKLSIRQALINFKTLIFRKTQINFNIF